MIPFSPPRIDDAIINEVIAVLKSGWITTGPRTKQFEKDITAYCGNKSTVCVNSWTMGMQVVLDWWGIGPGDEVILPAYTYCASGNVVLHSGAKLILVDVEPGTFLLDLNQVADKINEKTKAIIPVDIGGFPCDYQSLYKMVNDKKELFSPNNKLQEKLGRVAIFADAAHSFGAEYHGKKSGSLADITLFSFHAVKNLTTAEGGAICFNLPDNFNHDEIYKHICTKILHGQSKDALAKTQKGAWRYDVEVPGFKCNMTDLQAALGLIELARYEENLAKRANIFKLYNAAFSKYKWAIVPVPTGEKFISSYHLYQLRIDEISEAQRDEIIMLISEQDVAVNVHFQPLPMLTAYKNVGFDIKDFKSAYLMYANEISLPVYYDLSENDANTVIQTVITAVEKVLNS